MILERLVRHNELCDRVVLSTIRAKTRSSISSFPTYAIAVSSLTRENVHLVLDYLKEFTSVSKFQTSIFEQCTGIVLESIVEPGGRGKVVTVLLNTGVLRFGDWCVAGDAHGRVRGLRNVFSENVKSAVAGEIVQIMVFKDSLPSIADFFQVLPGEKIAQEFAEQRKLKKEYALQDRACRPTVKEREKEIASGTKPKKVFIEKKVKSLTVPVVLKTESWSSLEVIMCYIESLEVVGHSRKRLDSTLAHDHIFNSLETTPIKASIQVMHSSIGQVNKSDVTIATSVRITEKKRVVKDSCPIYYFGSLAPSSAIMKYAKQRNVSIKHFEVMPKLLDDLMNVLNYYKDAESLGASDDEEANDTAEDDPDQDEADANEHDTPLHDPSSQI